MARLGINRYGKAEVRVVRVGRGLGPDGTDVIRDWNVSSSLSGDLAATHLTGDNTNVLSTDAQKNTDYAFAQSLGPVEPETYALALARHFVSSQEPITRARVAVEEFPWAPIGAGGHSFAREGRYVRTCVAHEDQDAGTTLVSGLRDLVVLNTTNSEFWGFPRDRYTTLAETKDRMLATQVSATWRYRPETVDDLDHAALFDRALETLLGTFAGTYSYSLQQTLYAIGEAVVEAIPEVAEVRLALPNKHHFVVDTTPFGEPTTHETFYAADRPYGLIEGAVLADDAPDPGTAWL
ncbi:factor-independent urate hydroxylase [Jatrophihabitans sp. YIM 134969]